MIKKSLDFSNILQPTPIAYEKFHALTKTKRIIRYKSDRYWPKSSKKIYYKGYERMPEVALPPPKLPKNSLRQALIQRESKRLISNTPLNLQEISTLLFYSAGIKDKSQNRFYPSAGKRYPLEIYILTNNAALPKGLYHYYIKTNSLEELVRFKGFNFNKYFIDTWVKDAGTVILITGVFKRTSVKYGLKGYRFALLEAGHIAQNIYLLSSILGLNCCEIGGFIDDRLHKIMDIDGKEEAILTAIVLGK